jgi:hypothetical protein
MNLLPEEQNMNETITNTMNTSTTAKKKVSKKEKTKKRKQEITELDKHRMWEAFRTDHTPPKSDTEETNNSDHTFQDKNYDENYCSSCNSLLMVMDEGFPTCVNPQCGIIYRNTLDALW